MNRLHPWMLFAPLLIVGAASLEGFFLQHVRGRYDWRAYFSSLADAAIRAAVRVVSLGPATRVFGWLWAHRLYTMPRILNIWMPISAAFLSSSIDGSAASARSAPRCRCDTAWSSR